MPSNISATTKLLCELALDKSYVVRKSVASNPKASEETLAILSEDLMVEVRVAVAKNKNTPKDILIGLACDPNEKIRRLTICQDIILQK